MIINYFKLFHFPGFKIGMILTMLVSIITLSAQTVALEVEPNHSSLGFSIDIAGGITKVTGKFNSYKIYIDYVDSDITQSSFSLEIDVSSISTGISDRDNHLRTADFFDAALFPTITFESESVRKEGDSYVAVGDFSMHGATRKIELPFRMTGNQGTTLGFEMQCEVDRMEFGVGKDFKHSSMENFLAERVDVTINFWTRKRK